MRYFITGSDTGVGKTVVTALLAATAQARNLDVCVYKPVQTGSATEQAEDPATVKRWLARPVPVDNSYNFGPPATPWMADPDGLIVPEVIQARITALGQEYPALLVEGAGGLMVPVTASTCVIDLVEASGLAAILVVRPDLGTINHTLLSVAALRQRHIPLQAVVVSGYPRETDDLAVRTLPRVLSQYLPTETVIYLPPLTLSDGALGPEHPVVAEWAASVSL